MSIYRMHGLNFESEIELPACEVDGEPDWTIQYDSGTVPSHGDEVGAMELHGLSYSAGRSGGLIVIEIRDLLEATIDPETRQIHLFPRSDNLKMISLLTSGSLLAMALASQAVPTFHATAVEMQGKALALVGPSGAGKSTIAAMLCSQGASIISEDVVRIGADGTCHRGGIEVRLRPNAVGAAGDRLSDAKDSGDGRTVVKFAPSAECVPLGTFVFPALREPSARLRVELVTASDAGAALASSPRLGSLRDPTMLTEHFRLATALARQVPALRLHLVRGQGFGEEASVQLSEALMGSVLT
ncbi:MAG TPA: hypothetical protein VNA87_04350 [Actinomycetota bacterium]|nr:hypothetical protein [Actinomycetota bacterium]